MEQFLLNLSNHQAQDILEVLGMLENGLALEASEGMYNIKTKKQNDPTTIHRPSYKPWQKTYIL